MKLVVSTLKTLDKPEEGFVNGSRANPTNCESERSSTIPAGPPSDYCYADCFAIFCGAEGCISSLLVIDDKAFVASS